MINKVILVGHLSECPRLRETSDGTRVVNVRVITKSPRDRQSEWTSLTLFGKKAELLAEYGKEGKLVYFEGSLKTAPYTDKNGVTVRATEVIVNEFRWLDAPPSR